MNLSYHSSRPITIWIFTCAIMVLIMAMIGAVTRLTESGLSMVEWQPLLGILPPLSEAEWHRVFTLYQATPEYIYKHSYMDLSAFKSIFWWEWAHRFFGRMIGIVFLVPFLFFAFTRQISAKQMRYYALIFLIGAVQGGIGWYMVKSGLVDEPHVSHFRLALHLTMALFIFMILLLAGFNQLNLKPLSSIHAADLFKVVLVCLILTIITLIWGAFTAGLKAGYIYNEFPMMGDGLIPDEVRQQPFRLSQFWENPVAIQFFHRWIAISTFIMISYLWLSRYKVKAYLNMYRAINLVFGLALLQIILGISTLLSVVNISLATLHQGNAFLLVGALTYLAYRFKHAALSR